jgi:hypothetical protein
VTVFYESDEYSRLCPGKKDYLSIKIDGNRIHKQKRLLLANLNELYVAFKQKYESCKIGFSKFCELRPPWCITVGARGTHSVCICEIHQNVKLLLAAVGELKLEYTSLMSLVVCDIHSRDCMIHRCSQCPGKDALHTHITELIHNQMEMDEDDVINFKQWGHTDRTSIVTRQECVPDFINLLCDQLDNLTTHHYIAKAQAAYLSSCKETLHEHDNTMLVLLDFAENYSFIIQDSIQGFYWDNKQATLHPFAVYYSKDGMLCKPLSLCVISDCMQHDTVSVYAFINVVVKYLKEMLPHVKHVKYFSDGCGGQYKNYKNFRNLCLHSQDFGLSAEWHFFATSHGKSVCDEIGGTVKRLAARSSLQHTTDNHILTPVELYEWSQSNVHGITFFYVSLTDVEQHRPSLLKRFANAGTIPGTRSHHCFIPTSTSELRISRISADENGASTKVSISGTETSLNFQPGQYVATVYDQNWYLGNIVEISEEHQDLLINFMQPKGPARSFSWPRRRDECAVPIDHILCAVTNLTTITGRQYKLDQDTMTQITVFQNIFCYQVSVVNNFCYM